MHDTLDDIPVLVMSDWHPSEVQGIPVHAYQPEPGLAPAADAPPAPLTLDSTQTVHALTEQEIADLVEERWYAIELLVCATAVDPAEIPDLPILREYCLYSVGVLRGDFVGQSLRIGFFSSELAADAVTSFVRGHFSASSVVRVGQDERQRFTSPTVRARKLTGLESDHDTIEITVPRHMAEVG